MKIQPTTERSQHDGSPLPLFAFRPNRFRRAPQHQHQSPAGRRGCKSRPLHGLSIGFARKTHQEDRMTVDYTVARELAESRSETTFIEKKFLNEIHERR